MQINWAGVLAIPFVVLVFLYTFADIPIVNTYMLPGCLALAVCIAVAEWWKRRHVRRRKGGQE